jgi:hypothetical protein
VKEVAACDVTITPVADIDPPVAAALPLPLLLLGGAALGTVGYLVIKEIKDDNGDPMSDDVPVVDGAT